MKRFILILFFMYWVSVCFGAGRGEIFIAASDASMEDKNIADYVYDGVDADVQIQAAHDSISNLVGGKILRFVLSYWGGSRLSHVQ